MMIEPDKLEALRIVGLLLAAAVIASAGFVAGACWAATRFQALERSAAEDEEFWND